MIETQAISAVVLAVSLYVVLATLVWFE